MKTITIVPAQRIISIFPYAYPYLSALPQEGPQIHHINVENGDTDTINIYDQQSQNYPTKALIDCRLSASGQYLLHNVPKTASKH